MKSVWKRFLGSWINMNILFICKHNKFRSKIAEAFFKKLNKNKGYKIKSAGIIRGRHVNRKLKNYAKENGIHITSNPKSLTTNLVRWADLIILVADDVPESIFKNKEIKVWKISDADIEEKEKIKKIIQEIRTKVEELMKDLN